MNLLKTKPKVEVFNKTRLEVITDSAEFFLRKTQELGCLWDHLLPSIEAAIGLKLIDQMEVVVMGREGGSAAAANPFQEGFLVLPPPVPIAGVSMSIDWEKNQAVVNAKGEDFSDFLLGQDGRPGSITDAVEVLCDYLRDLKSEPSFVKFETWYVVRDCKLDELGWDRIGQLLDYPSTEEMRAGWRARYQNIRAAKKAKGTRTDISGGDLPESSLGAW